MKSYVISYFAYAEMPIRSLTNISLQYLQCLIVYLNYGIHETAYCHPALEYNIFRMCLFNLFVYMKNVTKQYSASRKVHKASQERKKKTVPVVRIKPGSLTHRTMQRTIVYLITDWIKGNGKLFFFFRLNEEAGIFVCACVRAYACRDVKDKPFGIVIALNVSSLQIQRT